VKRKTKYKNLILSEERDLLILHFLWKWKVSTTSALWQKFFGQSSQGRAYNRLLDLSLAGYIQSRTDGVGKNFVWTLRQKGFDLIRDRLPVLRAEGYQSENIYHDLVVTAAHLGNWFLVRPSGVGLLSEQELRNYHFDSYPSWAPKTDIHRPDGYWHIPTVRSNVTLALEVELSRKSDSDYNHVGDFYRFYENISRVLWIVRHISLGRRISKLTDGESPTGKPIHNFISLEKFYQQGWGSVIELGPEQGKSMTELLRDEAVTTPGHVTGSALLDLRKSPHRSKVSRPLVQSEFCY
jgi:hypothetical protein